MEYLLDYPNIPFERKYNTKRRIDLSEMPSTLFAGKNNSVFHIFREEDINKKDNLKVATCFCGIQCQDDFMSVCEVDTTCSECLSWLNQWMANCFYDETQQEWYSVIDETYLSK